MFSNFHCTSKFKFIQYSWSFWTQSFSEIPFKIFQNFCWWTLKSLPSRIFRLEHKFLGMWKIGCDFFFKFVSTTFQICIWRSLEFISRKWIFMAKTFSKSYIELSPDHCFVWIFSLIKTECLEDTSCNF